jgi:hypothetical protein
VTESSISFSKHCISIYYLSGSRGRFTVTSMCSQRSFVGFTPTIILPHPPHANLKQFQQVLLFCFHISIQSTLTIFTYFTLLFIFPPATGTSCFAFLFIIFLSVMVFHPWIYCTLIRLLLSLALLFNSFHSVCFIVIPSCKMQCSSILSTLFLLFSSP